MTGWIIIGICVTGALLAYFTRPKLVLRDIIVSGTLAALVAIALSSVLVIKI